MAKYKGLLVAGLLVVLWVLEGLYPHFDSFVRDRPARLRHAGRHLFLAALNGLIGGIVLVGLAAAAVAWATREQFGLANTLTMPPWGATAVILVLFDLWMYAWHRLNHVFPLLWRFHRTHHSDPAMDATSALRFHPGEIFLSGLLRIPVMVVLGMRLETLLLYELFLMPVILFHHSNLNIPERLDRILRVVIVTPRIHWVHHSRLVPETNSNYGSVLSVWDRLFGSLRFSSNPDGIQFGLDGFDEANRQSWIGLLKTPLEPPPG